MSKRFDDPYFSKVDGLSETRHVFLSGNDLPGRFRASFHIAELGFGTGLNLLAAWQAFLEADLKGQLHFTSFEAYPLSKTEMAKALSGFPVLAELTAKLLAQWPIESEYLSLPGLKLNLIIGDARRELPKWNGCADAWFLDGFSPAKNPDLWGPDLLHQVARRTKREGTFATYSAAGHIRRTLGEAGFRVSRVPGFARKRHMTVGTMAQNT